MPSATPTPGSVPAQGQDGAQDQDASSAADSSSAEADQASAQQPVAKNLETGLPLRSVMSPLHWGHLSLLSFSGFEAYNTNSQPQLSPLGSQFTSLQALVVYSIQKAKSSLDLQYNPYVWFSQNTSYNDFTAGSADLATTHTFNRRWSLTAANNFQYSPNLANTLQSSFAADFISNTSTMTPFMSVGRRSLFNNAGLTVNAQLSATSRLSFNGIDQYVRLGAYDTSANVPNLPDTAETLNAYGGGVTWSKQWNARNTINVGYNYRRQSMSGVAADTTFNSASVGFTRILKPSLSFSLQAGPGYSQSAIAAGNGTQKQHQLTAQGSAQLYKSFSKGGIALSFYRNSEFSGVISNSFNNRYDISFNRRMFTRWNVQMNASYIQQYYAGARKSTGELGWAELGYMLSRNWSVFSSYRYVKMSGNQALLGTQQMVAGGVRWAWQPESVHK
ncbi:MAG: hypothetical protein ACM3PW_15660 [Chlamydiota bacterium]